MGNYLKKLRKTKRWTQQKAADEFGMSKGGYIKIEDGDRGLAIETARRASEIYEVRLEEIYNGPRTVPIVGYVGAGSETHFYADGDDPREEALMPSNGTPDTVAAEIRGDSLGNFFNRWLIFYDEVRTPPTDDMLRRLCIVGLSDGRVLVKQIVPGSLKGHFHLVSQTEGIIENARVEWAAIVRSLAPR